MLPLWDLIEWYSSEQGLNYDIVTYPEWDDLPGITRPSRAFSLGVSSTTEHEDDVFKIIAFLLSEERQIEFAKKGQASVLVDSTANDYLYDDLKEELPGVAELNL